MSNPQAPSPGATGSKAPKAALLFIILTVVIDMLGVGLAWPILPQLIKELGGGTYLSPRSSTAY